MNFQLIQLYYHYFHSNIKINKINNLIIMTSNGIEAYIDMDDL